MPRGGRGSRGEHRLAAAGVLTLAGLLYGGAEYARQAWWMPSPSGVPGDSGGSLLLHLLLGLSVVSLPGLAAWVFLRRLLPTRPWIGWTGALFAASVPTLMLAFDRFAELLRWQWTLYEIGGGAYYLRLFALSVAVALVPVLVVAWWRPLSALPFALRGLGAALTVIAPLGLALGLSRAPVVSGSGPVPSERSPAVLLITIDTLRQDALAPYGGPLELPDSMVDARALDGWSVSPWTRPAMASLFSAMAPTGHGADKVHSTSSQVPWWPEKVRDAGWTTAAVTTNPFLRRRFGFDRGFDHYDHAEELEFVEPIARTFWAEWWQRRVVDRAEPDRADVVVEQARRWVEAADPARPWLLWVHLLDPHLPYHLRGEDGALAPERTPDWFAPLRGTVGEGGFEDLEGARSGAVLTTAAERQALHRLYLTEVAFSLHHVGRLVEAVRARLDGRDLVWILSSDHGEEFWDDGGFEHGHTLHDSVLEVPMLVGGSGVDRWLGTLGPRLRLHDIGPTLMSALGIEGFDPAPASGLLDTEGALAGMGLGRRVARGGAPALLAEGMLYGPPRTLLVAPDGVALERRDDDGTLERQRRWTTGAQEDSSAHPRLEALFLELDLWRERNAGRGEAVDLDADLERRLRAVGYVQ